MPFQNARLLVPGQWIVESHTFGFFCPDKHEGMIFAGLKPGLPKHRCHRPNFAWINAGSATAPAHRKPTLVINGFPAYRLHSAKNSVVYLVPKLGVIIGAHGPMAGQILATLRQSALATVLAKGPASPVPAHWVWRKFGGIKFAAPRNWHVSRATQWETCGTGVDSRSLDLINAEKKPVFPPCPFPYPTAANFAAVPGLTAVVGKFAATSVSESYPHCLLRGGTRICLSTQTGTGGFYSAVLIFSISKPHHHPAGYFLLGLSGTGARARAIFDSIAAR